MLENSTSPGKKRKRRESEVIVIKVHASSPLLFVDSPEDTLSAADQVTTEEHSSEGNRTKHKQKVKKRRQKRREQPTHTQEPAKKRKRKEKETHDQEEQIMTALLESSTEERNLGNNKKKKKKKKKRRESAEASAQRDTSPPAGGVVHEAQTVLLKEQQSDEALDTESLLMHWETERERFTQELRGFIPNVERKTSPQLYKMVKYDLPRFRQFKKEGLVLRRGRYSAKENQRLQQNVEDFLKLTGIDSAAKLFYPSRFPQEKSHIIKLKNQYKFLSRMAAGICRPWHDIYSRGRKMFDDFNYKGRFSEDDVKNLLKLQKLHGNKWMKISQLTGHSNHSLELRFSQLGTKKGVWTENELTSLMKAVRDHMIQLAEPADTGLTIRREKLYSKVPWTEVANQMQTRNWSQCRIKWMAILKQKMTAGANVYRGKKCLEAKIRLIKALHAMNVDDAADVNWEDLTHAFGDVPPNYVQSKFYKLKVTQVPLWKKMSFGDIIDFLYERVLPQLEKRLQSSKSSSNEETDAMGPRQKSFLFSDIFGDESCSPERM